VVQAAGVNMNTWIVGNAPVGHFVTKYDRSVTDDRQVERVGDKTFYMKARILAGQADLARNELGLTDYKWLTKEELQKELAPEYFRGVKNMLVET
jgi:large subunit ribosomal protein L46